jgi:hypothetical protein
LLARNGALWNISVRVCCTRIPETSWVPVFRSGLSMLMAVTFTGYL